MRRISGIPEEMTGVINEAGGGRDDRGSSGYE